MLSSPSECQLHLTRNQGQSSFETAREAFFDPILRVVDAGLVEGEPREAVIGMTVSWRLLYVIYVERGEAIRILSARPAIKAERHFYEDE